MPSLEWWIGAAMLAGLVYGSYQAGIQWERERPQREHAEALRLGEILAASIMRAHSELRNFETRIVEPDLTTIALIEELRLAKDALSDDKLAGAGLEAVYRLNAAADAVRRDSGRYMPILSEDEEHRLRRMGIDHPNFRNPEAAGRLRQDPS